MEHSLHKTAPRSKRLLVAHLRCVVALAAVLGSVSVLTANAFAADPAPLSGSITPALSTIAAPTPVAGRYIVTFSPDVSAPQQSGVLASAGANDVSTIAPLHIHVIDASDAVLTALRAD
ncbi:MAG: hypothetical protein E6G62_09815, partial [Actinobacteria bacterium]